MLVTEVLELRLAGEHMPYLSPVDQIAAVEHRNTRNISESRSRQEVVPLAIGAYRRVGIPSRKYRIIE